MDVESSSGFEFLATSVTVKIIVGQLIGDSGSDVVGEDDRCSWNGELLSVIRWKCWFVRMRLLVEVRRYGEDMETGVIVGYMGMRDCWWIYGRGGDGFWSRFEQYGGLVCGEICMEDMGAIGLYVEMELY